MVEYSSAAVYITSRQTDLDRITAIDAVIDALMAQALTMVENVDLTEYYIDTGQTKITSKFRSPDDILKAVKGYEAMKNYYMGRLNGRMVRQLPNVNFRFRNTWN